MNLQLLRIGQNLGNVIFTTVKKIVINSESSKSRERSFNPGLANSNAHRG